MGTEIDPKLLKLLKALESLRNETLEKRDLLAEDAKYNKSAEFAQTMLTLWAKELFDLVKTVGFQLETKEEMRKRIEDENSFTYEELLKATGLLPPDK